MYNQTILDPIALTFTLLMCIAILTIDRGKILIPLILVACFITKTQRIVIFTIDFPMLRILMIAGFLRIMMRNEQKSFLFNKIDKLLIWWSVIRTITHTLLWGTSGAFMNGLGQMIDTLGAYFLIRLAIYDLDEYETIIKTLVYMSVIISVFMIYEQISGGRNVFSIFGGVPEYNLIREGKLRSQGAFLHAITAGTFGGLLIPLSWALWVKNKKAIAMIGFAAGCIITITSSSSGPIATLACGVFGIFFWKFRKHLKTSLRLLVITLIFLHIVMKAPVWHLISRIDLVGGSTGYHRYLLIDNAIRRFYEWIFVGIRSTAHWGWCQEDVTNTYLFEGVYGGIIPLILFILIIKNCFNSVGEARTKIEETSDSQKFVWALGVVLFAHVISFISITYFDQMTFFYFMLIAMIACLNNLPSVSGVNKDKLELSNTGMI